MYVLVVKSGRLKGYHVFEEKKDPFKTMCNWGNRREEDHHKDPSTDTGVR